MITEIFKYEDWVNFMSKKYNTLEKTCQNMNYYIKKHPYSNILGKIFIRQVILGSSFKVSRSIYTICAFQSFSKFSKS